MNFFDKISQIEKLLGKSKRFKNKNLLAVAIYFKIRTDTSFRKLPLENAPFSWYNIRYWLQKLDKTGDLRKIEKIVGSE